MNEEARSNTVAELFLKEHATSGILGLDCKLGTLDQTLAGRGVHWELACFGMVVWVVGVHKICNQPRNGAHKPRH